MASEKTLHLYLGVDAQEDLLRSLTDLYKYIKWGNKQHDPHTLEEISQIIRKAAHTHIIDFAYWTSTDLFKHPLNVIHEDAACTIYPTQANGVLILNGYLKEPHIPGYGIGLVYKGAVPKAAFLCGQDVDKADCAKAGDAWGMFISRLSAMHERNELAVERG